ncbi:MAG TPA: hypothetical protein GX390_02195 [Acholeplasmataceae bacterium]|jgi:hypothetical protein|nr:hypothetical protein [Acholeplasmataceae bacterium]
MVDDILQREAYDCYRFLLDHTNFDENSSGCGLTRDRATNPNKVTIAGSGFMLSALVIGVENGWDARETNRRRVLLTVRNFWENIPHFHGFFAHYLEYDTGKRYKKCEYSTIDTALFLNGMLVADSYFACPEIHEYVEKIFHRVDWNQFVYRYNGRLVFRMAYNDIRGGDYLRKTQAGWIFRWSMMAEQLSMYALVAASPTVSKRRARALFQGFERTVGEYSGHRFVFTPLGALFVHQYSHAWFDFRRYLDMNGYDWFENSVQATLANRKYCLDRAEDYATFKAGLWGLSSCEGPRGYRGYGAPPFAIKDEDVKERTDGTVAVYAILASLPFCPEQVGEAVAKLDAYPKLRGPYGFYDSLNHDAAWYSQDYYSIDKGISLLMIDNHYRQTNWRYYMKHELIRNAVEKLGFIKKEEADVDD